MRTFYSVEFYDSDGQIDSGKREATELTKQQAHDVAFLYVKENPTCACSIYLEVEKPNGMKLIKMGLTNKYASRADTEAIVKGRGYKGKRIRSTLEHYGKIDSVGQTVLVR